MRSAVRILFINYADSGILSAHNHCLQDTVRAVLDGIRKEKRNVSATLLSLNARPESSDGDVPGLPKAGNDLAHIRKPGLTGSAVRRFATNVRFIQQYISDTQPDIVYLYGETALCTLLVHRFSSRIRYCFDSRGNFIAEEEANGSGRLRRVLLAWIIRRLARRMSLILTVSVALEIRFRKLSPAAEYCRLSNYFREDLFQADAGPSGKCTFVYAGQVQEYQAFDVIIAFFKAYHAADGAGRLMVVTPRRSVEVQSLIEASGLPEGTVSMTVCQDRRKLAGYLVQASAGLMLRRKSPINKAAFPTKFAEYLACGLPVISTPYVPDTAKIIEENRLGVLLDPEDPGAPEGIEKVRKLLAEPDIHERCATYARTHLSWDVHRGRIAKAILGEE